MKSIDFDTVADIYDLYANTVLDILFFLQETLGADGDVLELMAGSGQRCPRRSVMRR